LGKKIFVSPIQNWFLLEVCFSSLRASFNLFRLFKMTKDHNTARSKSSRAQRARRLSGNYVIIHNPMDGWARSLKKDPRFFKLGTVRFVPVPLVAREPTTGKPTPAYFNFLTRLEKTLKSPGGDPGSCRVVFGPTHGFDCGKISMALNADVDEDAPYWWAARDHFRPLYEMGVRRLHWHTCYIGTYLSGLPVTGVKSASPMTVTAWSCGIKPDDKGACSADTYIFQGLPSTTSMRKGSRRPWNCLMEAKINENGDVISPVTRCATKVR